MTDNMDRKILSDQEMEDVAGGRALISGSRMSGMTADVDHPGTLQWSFTISANYVKIS